MSFIVGNDVSTFQGDIDWDTYRKNANFALIKATEGTGFTDPKFSRNQSEARRVGIPLGYYHFARPDLNSADAEATWFVQAIQISGALRQGELLCLDYEQDWSGDKVTWCKTFLDTVASKLNGYKCLIYLNQSLAKSNDWSPVVNAGYGLWIAAYTGDPSNNNFNIGKWSFAAMQQWTDAQNVPGIQGAVDGDVFFGDAPTFQKYGYQPPAPPPVTPPVDTTNWEALCKQAQGDLQTYKDQTNPKIDLLNKVLIAANSTTDNLVADINLIIKNGDLARGMFDTGVTAFKGTVGGLLFPDNIDTWKLNITKIGDEAESYRNIPATPVVPVEPANGGGTTTTTPTAPKSVKTALQKVVNWFKSLSGGK